MSNPVTAAILQQDIVEPKPLRATSLLVWHHWTVSTPPLGRNLVVTNETNLFIAKAADKETKMWDTGITVLPFNDYPLWAEQPSFTKTTKRTSQAAKDVIGSPKEK